MTNKIRVAVETTKAILPSAGYNNRKATKHEYSHSEIVTLAGDSPVTGRAHYFKCTETGELRIWGFDANYTWEGN